MDKGIQGNLHHLCVDSGQDKKPTLTHVWLDKAIAVQPLVNRAMESLSTLETIFTLWNWI
ncbi:hypothetical protein CDG77_32750 [Nostoc sp. 'Peltigera membranacea cyanobiont' 213]|nr:hypothetical protein CDG77_32750 [Nostoc sp. 'Peltigera membranacea cyanobiont' 213]